MFPSDEENVYLSLRRAVPNRRTLLYDGNAGYELQGRTRIVEARLRFEVSSRECETSFLEPAKKKLFVPTGYADTRRLNRKEFPPLPLDIPVALVELRG